MKKIDILADYTEARISLASEVRKAVCDDEIGLCNRGDLNRELHVHTGIRTLAKEAGANLCMRRYGDDYTAYFFEYRGIEFFQLEENGEEPR